LRQGLERLFDRVDEAKPGDVLLLLIGGRAQHLAICSEVRDGWPSRMIHCYQSGPGMVCEVHVGSLTRIDSLWRWRD